MKLPLLFFDSYGASGFFKYLKLKLGSATKLKVPGYSDSVSLRKNSTDLSTFIQVFLRKEYQFDLPFEPHVIVDAGANIGLSALYFTNRYPSARIIAIEPENGNFNQLKVNTTKHRNIELLHCAISNDSNSLNLLDDGKGEWGYETVAAGTNTSANAIQEVKAVSVQALMQQFEIEIIDLFKIDIEGHERELFADKVDTWLPNCRCIVVEIHDHMREGASKSVFSAINNYNFDMQISGENLIFINRDLL